MENYIVFVLIWFIIDYVLFLSLKKLFKLECGNLSILFLQILTLVCSVMYLVLELKFYQYLIMKILVNVVICLLITDSYKFSKLAGLYFSSLILMFSYYGFSRFLVLFAQAVLKDVFAIKLSRIYDLLIIFAIVCYIFAVFKTVHVYSKNKNLKTFLKKVSFFAFGKHIEIVGLLDSGNVLYDSKTKLPVIIVSVFSLKKYLPNNIYKNITNEDYGELAVSHYLKVVTVANKEFDIPIIDIKEITLFDGEKTKKFKCVLGIVNHRFESTNSYECLLHRDFV